MDLDSLLSWVRRSPWLSPALDLHERWSPLRFFRASDEIVGEALLNVQTALRSHGSIQIVFNQGDSPPGLGDALSVGILARGLTRRVDVVVRIIGVRSNLELGQSNHRLNNLMLAESVVRDFAPKAKVTFEDEGSYTLLEDDNILFRKLVESKQDITRYLLLLTRNLILAGEFDLRDLGFADQAAEGGLVGYPVRRASIATDRNTNERTFLKDMQAIQDLDPKATVKLFGFQDEVAFFLDLIQKSDLGVNVISQESADFLEATFEATRCSLWVQRLGGGIAVPIFFSRVPFVFCSKDSVMARQLKLDQKSRKLFPWHSDRQVYLLRPLRARGVSLRKVLRRVATLGINA